MAAALILIGLYFLPTIVASARHHHNRGSIFVLNLFLGWTFIGWIIALAMACSHVERAQVMEPPVFTERDRLLESTPARFCPSCGVERRRSDAIFCSQCGKSFASKTY